MSANLELSLRLLLQDMVREEVARVRAELAPARPVATEAWLTTAEAAAMAKVRPATIRAWIAQGLLGDYRAGRLVRVKRDELAAYLAAEPRARRIGAKR